jgi:hypothetical protein
MDTNFDTLATGAFQFTIANGKVTAEQAVFGHHTETVHIPTGATFAVGTGTVTETIPGTHATYVIDYAAETGNPALYQVSDITQTVASPTTLAANGHVSGFSFTTGADGAVTGIQAVTGDSATATHAHTLRLPAGAQFATDGTTITETTVHGHEIDVTSFVQSGPAGLYAIASQSETFIPKGAATTALDVEPTERDQFTFGASGSVATASIVHADGTLTAITDSHVTFTTLAPGFVEEVTLHGSHAQFEVFHDGNGDGIYTAIAHGDGTHVDLTGLQAQIAKIDSFL